jgi:hypothetical protein
MRWLGGLVLAGVLVAAIAASTASAALFFLFSPAAAKPGDVVAVRTGGTPTSFTAAQRKRPLRPPIRIYLVPQDVAGEVRSRFDPRISFVGSLVPDRDTHGLLSFRAPPLDTGSYAVAAWCPGCAAYSRGSTFFVLTPVASSRFQRQMTLRLHLPPASERCPVTRGSYGNGILSTSVPGPDGVLATRRDPDGSLFQKLWWLPKRGFGGKLVVVGERLDAPGRMTVHSVNWGHSSDGRGSWASAVSFPSEGCWRLMGRVGDVSLSYVVRVVEGCGNTYTPPPCGPTARSSS